MRVELVCVVVVSYQEYSLTLTVEERRWEVGIGRNLMRLREGKDTNVNG